MRLQDCKTFDHITQWRLSFWEQHLESFKKHSKTASQELPKDPALWPDHLLALGNAYSWSMLRIPEARHAELQALAILTEAPEDGSKPVTMARADVINHDVHALRKMLEALAETAKHNSILLQSLNKVH